MAGLGAAGFARLLALACPVVLVLLVRLLLGAAAVPALLERLVAQRLLVAHHAVEIAHGLVALALRLLLAARPALGGLQVVEHAPQLVEHALGFGDVAVAQRLLHLVDHGLQLLGRDGPGLVVGPLAVGTVGRLGLLGHLGEVLVELPAQGFGEPLDLLGRRLAGERVLQLLLERLEVAFGPGQVAVLDLERHRPEQVGHADEVGILLGGVQPAPWRCAGRGTRRAACRRGPARASGRRAPWRRPRGDRGPARGRGAARPGRGPGAG